MQSPTSRRGGAPEASMNSWRPERESGRKSSDYHYSSRRDSDREWDDSRDRDRSTRGRERDTGWDSRGYEKGSSTKNSSSYSSSRPRDRDNEPRQQPDRRHSLPVAKPGSSPVDMMSVSTLRPDRSQGAGKSEPPELRVGIVLTQARLQHGHGNEQQDPT
jgi:hypothetical protein